MKWVLTVAGLAAILAFFFVGSHADNPPSQDNDGVGARPKEPRRPGSGGVRLDEDRVPVERGVWARIRSLCAETGQRISAETRLVRWTEDGISAADIKWSPGSPDLELPERPTTEEQVYLFAEGYLPENVSDLVRRPGDHDCLLKRALSTEILMADGHGTPVGGVPLALCPAEDPGRQRIDASRDEDIIWPIASEGTKKTFALTEGTYRPIIRDSSLAIIDVDDTVAANSSIPSHRVLHVGGLVVGLMRFVNAAPSTISLRLPEDFVTIPPRARMSTVVTGLQKRFGECTLRLVATRSLPNRFMAHDVKVSFSVAGAPPQDFDLSLQPITRAAIQEFNLSPPEGSGAIRICVTNPDGSQLSGISIMMRAASKTGTKRPPLIVRSGETCSAEPGDYRLHAVLPRGSAANSPVIHVIAGSLTEAEVKLARSFVFVELSVCHDDGSCPEFVSAQVRNGEWSDAIQSTKPSSIPMWVPAGRGTVLAMISPEITSGEVEVDFTRAAQAKDPVMITLRRSR